MNDSWVIEQANRVINRLKLSGKTHALFETGYGPSGLPHIGTFCEVARTTWVRRAFENLSGMPSRLIVFSDDMDGLRKAPENVPNREMLQNYIGHPLSLIPDPFETHESYAAHNNAQLRSFLDSFDFEYEFASATDYYASGKFDETLIKVLQNYQKIMDVVLPTFKAERQATYSPFLPIHPETGVVMQFPVRIDLENSSIIWQDNGKEYRTSILGGACKLQWKADWAMRWAALDVDFEMSGKDLIGSVTLSTKICKIIGNNPPESMIYELFLDKDGKKISKSVGNGISVEDWLRYAPAESLSQFMYHAPQRAKKLHFDVIPKAMDEYLDNSTKVLDETNPVFFIGKKATSPISFTMLLNLASVVNAETPDMLWGFLRQYTDASPETLPYVSKLITCVIAYHADFVKKNFRVPTEVEQKALLDLIKVLQSIDKNMAGEDIQTLIYEVGKRHPFAKLRDWFSCLYQVLLGQVEGPRFGGFVELYGVDATIALIQSKMEIIKNDS
jgi:lysyl-tRNA synthetase class 1